MSSNQRQRVAVFGGTFDPVHLGHLLMAEQAREQAALDLVWFMPAASPPHKQERLITPFAQRVEMLALAVAGQAAFHVNELEGSRAGPSYTVDTLTELCRRYPETDFHWLIGSDCLQDLPGWRQPARIMQLAGLLVAPRPGWPLKSRQELLSALGLATDIRFQPVDVPLIDLSSRDLRRRAAQGRSLRFMVPRAVECYIQEKKLYRNTETT
jgi:nicotinate-nucleotide adenylyltransferase